MARPRKAPEAPAPETTPEIKAPEAPAPGLVAMVKGGDVLHVHPTCVKAHADAGWKVSE